MRNKIQHKILGFIGSLLSMVEAWRTNIYNFRPI